MSIVYRLSTKGRKQGGITLYEVLARLHSNGIDQYAKTGVFVPQSFTDKNGNKKVTWDNGIVIPKISYTDDFAIKVKDLLTEAKKRLQDIENKVAEAYSDLMMQGKKPPKGWLQGIVNERKPKQDEDGKASMSVIEALNMFIASDRQTLRPGTLKQYKLAINWVGKLEKKQRKTLTLDGFTADDLHGIKAIMLGEGMSGNYVVTLFRKFRTFVRWANGLSKTFPIEPLTHNNPFDRYSIGSEEYGTPFYLTQEERNILQDADLPPRLAIQRDIFVFQCLIGCRISDLWAMTGANIINGAIEYIPRKTKDGRPITVRVPLNSRAKAILDKYDCKPCKSLFNFVAQQQYNEDIKEMLRLAGITRMVTILDPVTREEVKRPISEVASSHMARRTFVGNLYKQVKDPNLVSKLSGHAEGSKAFARYRDIDDDIAKELVKMLE